jgi:hypothetical protein
MGTVLGLVVCVFVVADLYVPRTLLIVCLRCREREGKGREVKGKEVSEGKGREGGQRRAIRLGAKRSPATTMMLLYRYKDICFHLRERHMMMSDEGLGMYVNC